MSPIKKPQSLDEVLEEIMKKAPLVRDPNFSDYYGRVCEGSLPQRSVIVYH